MARRTFTEEQIAELEKCSCISFVSANTVRFTEEFRRTLYLEMEEGKTAIEVLEEHGVPTRILGEKRIANLVYLSRKQHERESNGDISESKEEKSLEARVRMLEHKLAYAEQEVEFLKKLRKADLEAQKEWESKHRQK